MISWNPMGFSYMVLFVGTARELYGLKLLLIKQRAQHSCRNCPVKESCKESWWLSHAFTGRWQWWIGRWKITSRNQRIEAWWSFLRRCRSGWWIDFFQDMLQQGILETGNTYYIESMWYCFNKLLQEDLTKVKEHWNSHYVRRSQHETVSGIPEILYFLPEYYGGENCLMEISAAKLTEMEERINPNIDDNAYKEYFDCLWK